MIEGSTPPGQLSPERPSDVRGRAAVAGLAAAAATSVALAALHSAAPGFPFPPTVIAQAFVRIVPGGIATFFIERTGHLSLPLAVAGVAAAFLGGGALLGTAVPRLRRRGAMGPASFALSLLPLWVLWVAVYPADPGTVGRPAFAAATFVPVLAGAWAGERVWNRLLLSPGGGSTAGQVAAPPEPAAPARPSAPSPAGRRVLRRQAIRSIGLGTAGLLAGNLDLGRLIRRRPDPGEQVLDLPHLERIAPLPRVQGDAAFERTAGLTPAITTNRDFYVVDEAVFDPVPDAGSWRLEVSGHVKRPLVFDYERLRSLPAVERYRTLECISNPVGGDLIGTAKWAGVPVPEVLEMVGARPGAAEVVFRSADGYSDSIGMDQAMSEETLLAIGMNGRVLPRAHGFPARLLSLGTYGMKNPKWITGIEVVDEPYLGYWEQRGWSKAAIVKTGSRIDVPTEAVTAGSRVAIAGVAFAGDRGISAVEVSADDGRTWIDAALETPLSDSTWVRWRAEWTPEAAGTATLLARAYDGRGRGQTAEETDPHPSGAGGYPVLRTEVRG